MIKAQFVDRHAEHVDPEIPLCYHGPQRYLEVGDKWTCSGEIGQEVFCEIEVEVLAEKEIRVTVNHLDYLIARRVDSAIKAKLRSLEAEMELQR